jgi:hypothetical protein
VDHIEAIACNKFEDFKTAQVRRVNNIDNLQPLCFSCHVHKTKCDASNSMSVDADLAIAMAHCLGY